LLLATLANRRLTKSTVCPLNGSQPGQTRLIAPIKLSSITLNQPRGFGPQPRSIMKIIFTKEEIKEIILAHVHRECFEEFNDIEIKNWNSDEFATVTYIEPTIQEPSNET
jgi:hypothetical protein